MVEDTTPEVLGVVRVIALLSQRSSRYCMANATMLVIRLLEPSASLVRNTEACATFATALVQRFTTGLFRCNLYLHY